MCEAALRVAWGLFLVSLASRVAGRTALAEQPPSQQVNTWVKLTPLENTPVSPRLGYEGACVWDSKHRVVLRYGGHNQGGGGEQGSEVWTCDPLTLEWKLQQPNTSPPGVCCNAQNLFDPIRGRYLRFPSFSGSHGWQWWREIYLNDSSVWMYDLADNTWRNMRPLPAPHVAPLRSAAWNTHHHVALVFGGEGGPRETVVYDPHRNEWRWMQPDFQPEPRSGGQMAYEEANRVHVLFGSQFTDDPHTWIYSLEENKWRDAQPPSAPPTDKNDAVLTYDPGNRAVLAIIKVTEGEEENSRHDLQTWKYEYSSNRWTKLNPGAEPEPSGNRARQLMFAPELGLALLENCTSKPREQQLWTYRLGPAAPAAAAAVEASRAEPAVVEPAVVEQAVVEQAVVSVHSPTRIEIAWQPVANASRRGYYVERAVVEVWSDDQLVRLKRATPPLDPPSVGAIRRIGPFQRLNSELLRDCSYIDLSVDLRERQAVAGEAVYEPRLHEEHLEETGRPYPFAVFAYRIRSVAAADDESGPSPAFFTIPGSPQWVFSREEGTTCHLKWARNPESSVSGYRVYRMDGRYDRETVTRLTDEPLSATTYSDPDAGDRTRRYYVVAVDSLGQEGFPSSPVWYQREWRQFYEPFVGDWHQ
jgi:hypothetical protein